MTYVNREIADKYQEFFNFMSQEHNLILTIEQMDEVIFEAQRLAKKLTIPNVVGRGEQLCDHPIDKRSTFKSHGKDFCWKCGKHIEA